MATTARDIINSALQDCGVFGVGQTPLAEDMNDGLTRLNRMIGSLNNRRWLLYHLVDVSAPGTGSATFTVGPGQQFNVARPATIEAAYFRKNATTQAIDYPLQVLPSREDYSLIAMKGLVTWPQCVFYDATFPVGTLYIYPVPSDPSYQIHIVVKEQLSSFANLSTTVTLPPGYEEFLEYSLAARLCAKYQVQVPPVLADLLRASASSLRDVNVNVPLQQMPAEVTFGRGIGYNIFSDR